MFGGGHQIRDWIYVEDHCEAIWKIEENKVINEKFIIGGDCELQNIVVTKKILDLYPKVMIYVQSVVKMIYILRLILGLVKTLDMELTLAN